MEPAVIVTLSWVLVVTWGLVLWHRPVAPAPSVASAARRHPSFARLDLSLNAGPQSRRLTPMWRFY